MRRVLIVAVVLTTLFAVRNALKAAEVRTVAFRQQDRQVTYYRTAPAPRRVQRQGFFARWMEMERQKNARLRQMFRGR